MDPLIHTFIYKTWVIYMCTCTCTNTEHRLSTSTSNRAPPHISYPTLFKAPLHTPATLHTSNSITSIIKKQCETNAIQAKYLYCFSYCVYLLGAIVPIATLMQSMAVVCVQRMCPYVYIRDLLIMWFICMHMHAHAVVCAHKFTHIHLGKKPAGCAKPRASAVSQTKGPGMYWISNHPQSQWKAFVKHFSM